VTVSRLHTERMLQEECKKAQPDASVVHSLTLKTFALRRQKIVKEYPPTAVMQNALLNLYSHVGPSQLHVSDCLSESCVNMVTAETIGTEIDSGDLSAELTDLSDTETNITLLNVIDSKGALSNAASFVCRLHSNPMLPLSTSLDIVESSKDLVSSLISVVKSQTTSLLQEHSIDSEKSQTLMQTLSLLENPFVGLETLRQQSAYFIFLFFICLFSFLLLNKPTSISSEYHGTILQPATAKVQMML